MLSFMIMKLINGILFQSWKTLNTKSYDGGSVLEAAWCYAYTVLYVILAVQFPQQPVWYKPNNTMQYDNKEILKNLMTIMILQLHMMWRWWCCWRKCCSLTVLKMNMLLKTIMVMMMGERGRSNGPSHHLGTRTPTTGSFASADIPVGKSLLPVVVWWEWSTINLPKSTITSGHRCFYTAFMCWDWFLETATATNAVKHDVRKTRNTRGQYQPTGQQPTATYWKVLRPKN